MREESEEVKIGPILSQEYQKGKKQQKLKKNGISKNTKRAKMFRQKKITGELRAIGKNDYQKGKNLGAKTEEFVVGL